MMTEQPTDSPTATVPSVAEIRYEQALQAIVQYIGTSPTVPSDNERWVCRLAVAALNPESSDTNSAGDAAVAQEAERRQSKPEDAGSRPASGHSPATAASAKFQAQADALADSLGVAMDLLARARPAVGHLGRLAEDIDAFLRGKPVAPDAGASEWERRFDIAHELMLEREKERDEARSAVEILGSMVVGYDRCSPASQETMRAKAQNILVGVLGKAWNPDIGEWMTENPVAPESSHGCGECAPCKAGSPSRCVNGPNPAYRVADDVGADDYARNTRVEAAARALWRIGNERIGERPWETVAEHYIAEATAALEAADGVALSATVDRQLWVEVGALLHICEHMTEKLPGHCEHPQTSPDWEGYAECGSCWPCLLRQLEQRTRAVREASTHTEEASQS